MQGYITEKVRKPGRGGQTSLYPYAKTRADVKDFADMTPEEIIEWWID